MGVYVTADPDTRIIEITKVPVGGVSTLDVQVDIYSDLKEDWVATPALQNLKFPLRSFGDPKTPEQAIGPYVFLSNDEGWRIQPYDGDHELTLNGNLVAEDVTIPKWEGRAARSIFILEEQSAQALTTVKELVDLQFSSYNGGVTVDAGNSSGNAVSGTDFPTGTPRQPVDNIVDALAIISTVGLPKRIYVLGDYTFTTGDSLDGYEIFGENVGSSTFTVNTAALVQNCEFHECFLTGTLDGNNTVIDGHVEDVDYVDGAIERCVITGTITLSAASKLFLLDCWSGRPGVATPTIDFGGGGTDLAMRNYAGGALFTNCSAATDVSVDMASGQLTLDATITAGTFACRGVGKLTDNSVGATVIDEMLDARRLILIEKILRNRFETNPGTGTATLYDDDGVTPLLAGSIWQNVAGTTPYDGTAGVDRRDRLA